LSEALTEIIFTIMEQIKGAVLKNEAQIQARIRDLEEWQKGWKMV